MNFLEVLKKRQLWKITKNRKDTMIGHIQRHDSLMQLIINIAQKVKMVEYIQKSFKDTVMKSHRDLKKKELSFNR